jgi:GNAT superfamily N-acetyltransferase
VFNFGMAHTLSERSLWARPYRKTGVGTELLETCEDLVRKKGDILILDGGTQALCFSAVSDSEWVRHVKHA